MVSDPVSEVKRLAKFIKLCFSEAIIDNVTHRNSQEYYKQNNIKSIQDVCFLNVNGLYFECPTICVSR